MSDAAITFTILPLATMVALLVTAAIAYVLGRRLERDTAVIIAGFSLPIIIMIAAYYGVTTDEPDGPPPGIILLGALAVAAVTAPVTLIVSWFVVRHVRR